MIRELNASINELTPLVAKNIVRTNPIDKSPDLGLLIISYIVENAISLVCGGKIVED